MKVRTTLAIVLALILLALAAPADAAPTKPRKPRPGDGGTPTTTTTTAPATTTTTTSTTSPTPPTTTTTPPGTARLLWADEFDSLSYAYAWGGSLGSPGAARWAPNDGTWQQNRGFKDFNGASWNLNPGETLGGASRSAASIVNGRLRLSAIRTPDAWKADIAASMAAQGHSGPVPEWSGGMLISNPTALTFTYGYIEVAASFTPGKGMFPAVWLYRASPPDNYPAKSGAELDLVEIFGVDHGMEWATYLHYGGARPSFGVVRYTDTAQQHVYGLEKTPSALNFYRDGVLLNTITGEDASWFDVPMSVILNFTMDAPWFGTYSPSRLSDATTPSVLHAEIDYVRAYSAKP